jgi:hypothetical protein
MRFQALLTICRSALPTARPPLPDGQRIMWQPSLVHRASFKRPWLHGGPKHRELILDLLEARIDFAYDWST